MSDLVIADKSEIVNIADYVRELMGTTNTLTLSQIKSNLNTVKTNIDNAFTALGEKGVTVPDKVTSDLLGGVIENIKVDDGSFKAVIERTVTEVTLPSDLTKIGDYAFSDYTNLTSILLPDTLTNIGNDAFAGCTNLALTSLPNNIEKIGMYAFSGCKKLALKNLPDKMYYNIYTYTFYNCTELAIESFPPRIDSIYDYAFGNCTNIKKLIFHRNISRIERAFTNCTGITEVTFKGRPSSISNNAFYGCTNLTTINVPWAEGAVTNAPWGATNATINYNYTGE